ncbi:hypothetical protein Y032_0285g1363 [Ancylostoma ceylanicum]|uniref:Uncharacterized protein n=1 Tax=Ancylostoma ceylanicum TaxID=53326 RepID=A0A016S692_9BILA|nr:hypothetical protein Y032_0285g1363 [Ancylostoma ceylanicum]
MYRCFPNDQYPQSMPSYSERLKIFKLRTLLYRRVFNDIVFCFKVLKGEVRLKASKFWIFKPSRGRTSTISIRCDKICKKQYNVLFYSLFFRGARWLQMLPARVLEAPSISTFKKRLRKINLLPILHIPEFKH